MDSSAIAGERAPAIYRGGWGLEGTKRNGKRFSIPKMSVKNWAQVLEIVLYDLALELYIYIYIHIYIYIYMCVCVCVYFPSRFLLYKMPNNLHLYSRAVISDYLVGMLMTFIIHSTLEFFPEH